MPDNEIPDTAGDHYHLCYLHLRKLKKMAIYSVNYGGRGYPQNPRLLFGTRKTILEPFEPILQSTRYPHL